jgi:FixJ family two-component response regulator
VIAIVDDDPRILESLQDLLESAGYEARTHSSGAALLAGGTTEIDCLITDIGMPVMDGFELRDRMKGLCPGLPVFLISGRRDLAHEACSDSGTEPKLFLKPFDGSTLLAAIGKALGGVYG